MNKKEFIEGMTILKSVFIDWQFDLNNPTMVRSWFAILEPLSPEEFSHLLQVFCRTKVKPPTSPAEFFRMMAVEEEKRFISPGEAFNKVLMLIREHGFVYGSAKIYAAIEDNPALTKTVKEMESELRELVVGDEFVPERFRKAYRYNVAVIAEKRKDERLNAARKKLADQNQRRLTS